MPPPKTYVRTDEHGVMRVGDTRVMLDSLVASFEQGYSPETIQQQYSTLTLEEVYGAIAWYLANANEVAQYLERQQAVWDHWRTRAETQPSPVIQRLRAWQTPSKSPLRKLLLLLANFQHNSSPLCKRGDRGI